MVHYTVINVKELLLVCLYSCQTFRLKRQVIFYLSKNHFLIFSFLIFHFSSIIYPLAPTEHKTKRGLQSGRSQPAVVYSVS